MSIPANVLHSTTKKYPWIRKPLIFFKNNTAFCKIFINILTFGCLFFFIWHFRVSLESAFETSLTIGWNILYLPLIFLIWNGIATYGWMRLLQSTSTTVNSFLYLFSTRVQCQALNFILPLLGVGGEFLRSVKTAKQSGVQNSVISVSIDKAIDIFADCFLAAVGILAASRYLPHRIYFILLSLVMIAGIMIIFFHGKSLIVTLNRIIPQSNRQLFQILTGNKRLYQASRIAFFSHCVEHTLMAAEIYIVSHFIGIDLTIPQLFLINSVSSVFSFVFFFVPGRFGSYEGSLAFAFQLLSLSPTAGLSVALIRRARQFSVCCFGILLTTDITQFKQVTAIKGKSQWQFKKDINTCEQ